MKRRLLGWHISSSVPVKWERNSAQNPIKTDNDGSGGREYCY
jgi:hypothetical protein